MKKLLILLFCAISTCAQTINIKYFVDPSLVSNDSLIQTHNNLGTYTSYLNYILAHTTNKRLNYTGFEIKIQNNHQFFSGYSSFLPNRGYEIWVDLDYTAQNYTHGGYLSFNSGGEAVLADIKCPKIYNINGLQNVADFWLQITTILHEFAHIFGAGQGEYYNLNYVWDFTGISPTHHLFLDNQSDPFWSNKRDFVNDPLTGITYNNYLVGYPNTLQDLLDKTYFSQITSWLINNNYRLPAFLPVLPNKIRFIVYDSLWQPVTNANIKIWRANSNFLIFNGQTDNSGVCDFIWDYDGLSWDNLRLAKIIKPGYTTKTVYFSSFDLQYCAMTGKDKLLLLFFL